MKSNLGKETFNIRTAEQYVKQFRGSKKGLRILTNFYLPLTDADVDYILDLYKSNFTGAYYKPGNQGIILIV